MIAAVAVHQMVSLRRQRVFTALLATLLVMTALAGVIGWLSHNTIVRVYDQAARIMAEGGRPAPPDPFEHKATLSLLSNMVIYIPLIGALLALVLGHLSLADDQAGGVGRLIFSRPVARAGYALGKVLAAAAVLAVALAASLAVSALALLVVNRTAPTWAEATGLTLFYLLSWAYVMVFALVGMATVLVTRRRSLALLLALGVWLVLTFAVPQFTSGLRPTASLNPVSAPVGTSQSFFRATAHARPFSVSEQYKEASARVLGTAPVESRAATARRALPIAAWLAALGTLTALLVRRHDYSRATSDE